VLTWWNRWNSDIGAHRVAGIATITGAQVDLTLEEASMGLSDFRVDAAIAVSDLAMARHFYEETLGLVAVEVEEQGVRYQCAEGTRIFIYLSPANAGTSSATVAGWFVDDLDQTMNELDERGAVFERYDQPGIKTDERGVFDAGRFRAAWLKDPDGNTLALTQLTATV
jgi:catechol 2,3-dioxygenase-like lactoylglutathione lyase family enzyme